MQTKRPLQSKRRQESFLSSNQDPVISLDGFWRFHPRWASPDFDDKDWALLNSDKPWTAQGYRGLADLLGTDSTYWMRCSAEQATSSSAPIDPHRRRSFPEWRENWGVGRMPPHGSLRFNQTLLYRLEPTKPDDTIHFAIRVWHHPIFATYLGGGIALRGARLGEEAVLKNQFRMMEGERLSRVARFFCGRNFECCNQCHRSGTLLLP